MSIFNFCKKDFCGTGDQAHMRSIISYYFSSLKNIVLGQGFAEMSRRLQTCTLPTSASRVRNTSMCHSAWPVLLLLSVVALALQLHNCRIATQRPAQLNILQGSGPRLRNLPSSAPD